MINARDDAYRHVALSGRFLNDREILVQAVTERGSGFWVMTPFATDWGFTVLVNRGFVPSNRRDPATRPEGQIAGDTAFAGLMRMSEPGGAFLRANDPLPDAGIRATSRPSRRRKGLARSPPISSMPTRRKIPAAGRSAA